MRTIGWGLLLVTFLLVFTGAVLYTSTLIGWAQLLWVMASGTAGAGVMALIEQRHDDYKGWDDRSFWDGG